MTKQILKVVLAGALAGAALFIMPFLIIRLVVFFLLISLIFRLVGRRGHWQHQSWRYGIDPQKRYAFAKRWHNMSTDERTSFMQKMEGEMFNKQESVTETK